MERTQFTFYESFFKAISRIKKKADRCDAYDAICQYAMYGTEPDLESLPDSVAIAFELSKPNLDSSRRKASNGQKGGKTKQSESKTEANDKQTASKKENENEIEKENEIEYECTPIPPAAVVLSAYANKINPVPSQTCVAELERFVSEMGQDVCLRAIDVAVDERRTNWSYVRGILKAKQEQGVKCLADWERVDAEFEARKKKPSKNQFPACAGPDKQAVEDMARMRRLMGMEAGT
jgi:DnaD/phage-associated family protein